MHIVSLLKKEQFCDILETEFLPFAFKYFGRAESIIYRKIIVVSPRKE